MIISAKMGAQHYCQLKKKTFERRLQETETNRSKSENSIEHCIWSTDKNVGKTSTAVVDPQHLKVKVVE